jgi:hypothetical protein
MRARLHTSFRVKHAFSHETSEDAVHQGALPNRPPPTPARLRKAPSEDQSTKQRCSAECLVNGILEAQQRAVNVLHLGALPNCTPHRVACMRKSSQELPYKYLR